MEKYKALVLAAVFLSLFGVACGQKKDDSANVGAARGEVDPRLSGGPLTVPGGQAMAASRGFVTQASDAQMTQSARDFVSSFIDPTPQNVGDVSSQNGVTMTGRVQYDASGRVLGQSYIEINISDALVGQTNSNGDAFTPIRVMVPATLVQGLAGSGVRISFSDQFGSIIVEGTWNNTMFSGTITFQNLKHVGGLAPISGTLGNFQIPTCGFFVCG